MHEDIRHCGVLIVDIAGSTRLRSELGDVAAGRQILHLLDLIIANARERGASFIKAYGDDVLAVFEQDSVTATADMAVLAQQLAANVGLKLYAGFHFGPVVFRLTDGHPDVTGQTVNMVARLHKLADDVPGQIFLLEEAVSLLPDVLRCKALPFGNRALKGLGKFNVWTLNWQSSLATALTVYASENTTLPTTSRLVLWHGTNTLTLNLGDRKRIIGRGSGCDLQVDDPELKVSSTHLAIECIEDHWFLQDISRNGTWLRNDTDARETLLPYCQKMNVPGSGSLSLGRPFSDDTSGRFTLRFEIKSGT